MSFGCQGFQERSPHSAEGVSGSALQLKDSVFFNALFQLFCLGRSTSADVSHPMVMLSLLFFAVAFLDVESGPRLGA